MNQTLQTIAAFLTVETSSWFADGAKIELRNASNNAPFGCCYVCALTEIVEPANPLCWFDWFAAVAVAATLGVEVDRPKNKRQRQQLDIARIEQFKQARLLLDIPAPCECCDIRQRLNGARG